MKKVLATRIVNNNEVQLKNQVGIMLTGGKQINQIKQRVE